MTRDDIIRMARETKLFDLVDVDCKEVRDFVALVAAAEREACAQIAFNAKTYLEAAAAIRERGAKKAPERLNKAAEDNGEPL